MGIVLKKVVDVGIELSSFNLNFMYNIETLMFPETVKQPWWSVTINVMHN